jgi:phosphoenolpyruvate carboxykinase (ATP)
MTPENFSKLKTKVLSHLEKSPRQYLMNRSVGADSNFALEIELHTNSASHALFALNMFRPKIARNDFTILHAPDLEVDPKEFATKTGTVIVTSIEEKMVIIVGTRYAGEIKKSAFSLMNYLLPTKKTLPMHSGASMTKDGEVSVFFGLSGTGKTTLSADTGLRLIGDDEHGLNEHGVFNFEGGCYAKTYKLAEKTEPEIFKASNRFGTILENVVMDEKTRTVDFFDASIAENGRSSYPIEFIPDFVESGKGGIPKNIFFLSADAFGILPPVAKLNRDQAMFYFLSGYTAKLAGTEMGIVHPQAAFSACFGAPFMLRHATVYAELLGHYLDQFKINVWLINTGWTGGAYGVGERFPLKVTRQIIREIQKNGLSGTQYLNDEIFGFAIPKTVPGVDDHILVAKSTWKDQDAYNFEAKKLAQMFIQNCEKFGADAQKMLKAGPKT